MLGKVPESKENGDTRKIRKQADRKTSTKESGISDRGRYKKICA